MNLQKLFDTQRELDNRIVKEKGLEGQHLLPMRILALQVELGELANEWRGFKFWSEDQEPRRERIEIGFRNPGGAFEYKRNPLLEEYVDCLHFILSIGLELGCKNVELDGYGKRRNIIRSLIDLNLCAATLIYSESEKETNYSNLFSDFIGLGEMLGFKWDEIEEAYMQKNATNHERQESGY